MGKVLPKVTDAIGFTDTGAAKDMANASMASMREAAARLEKVPLPVIEKMMLDLELPQIAQLLQSEELGPSQLQDIKVDPRLQSSQMQALEMLKQRGDQGLTEEDRIAFRQFSDQTAQDEQARQASILADMEQRGMSDSGTSLAAQLSSNQAAAQRQQQQGAQMAQAALQAKRDALAQSGNLASQMSTQQFGQESQKASAQDAISQFNLANRMNVQQANVGTKQRIGEAQSATRNQQQMFNKNLQQQQFENEMRKAGGLSQASTNMAQMQGSMASQQAASNQASMGALVGAGATVAGAAFKSDERVKENISKPSEEKLSSHLKTLLDKIEPYMYNYKNSKDGEGTRLGIMAQDLEKSEAGKEMVNKDIEGIRNVDLGHVATAALATSKHLLDRLDSLEKKIK